MTPQIPAEPINAITWAVQQRPAKWEVGEWLARIMPEGSWSEMEADDLADQIVGAAIRALDEDPPR